MIFTFPSILGQEEVKKQINSALLAERNIVLVGPPGVGKTTLAKSIADSLPEIEVPEDEFHPDGSKKTKKIKGDERFVRIQGSPDLTVEDLIGDIDPIKALKFGPLSLEAFTPGKIFKANHGVLFFDELNRAPEKLQNALLQALQEKKVTIGGFDIDFPTNFIFIGTMNPDDFTGTEKLSEVLLDRFDMIYLDYPESTEIEQNVITNVGKKFDNISFPDNLFMHMINFVRVLRQNEALEQVPSVRASLGLFERAQANAVLENKNEVSLRHIQDAMVSVLVHRIKLKPSVKYLKTPENFINEMFSEYCKDNGVDMKESGEAG